MIEKINDAILVAKNRKKVCIKIRTIVNTKNNQSKWECENHSWVKSCFLITGVALYELQEMNKNEIWAINSGVEIITRVTDWPALSLNIILYNE